MQPLSPSPPLLLKPSYLPVITHLPSYLPNPCREIAKLKRGTSAEVEAFVHGALCVSYSGQCFSSEAWGGRSANRGQCAQACRMPYGLIVNGELRVRLRRHLW